MSIDSIPGFPFILKIKLWQLKWIIYVEKQGFVEKTDFRNADITNNMESEETIYLNLGIQLEGKLIYSQRKRPMDKKGKREGLKKS